MTIRKTLPIALVTTLACAGVACSSSGTPSAPTSSGPLARAFELSATLSGVPRDVMVAIAQTEGSLDMPRVRDVAPDAAVPVAGPMQLRHGRLDTLARGAALMHTTELALRRDADLALEAGARVLAEVALRTAASPDDLTTWEAALEEMSGYADDLHRRAYAHRVFGLLARGGTFEGRDGEPIALPAHDIPPTLWMTIDTSVHTENAPADYGPAEWFPTSCTNKCTPGRGGFNVELIVIHDTEGGWDASVATLQNDSGKSVQYIVGTDGRVGQFIHEVDTAWHAGNFNYNERSVGIEHVGYANKPYTDPQYDASAKLVTYLTDKFGVKKDRAHIVGHDQVPNGNAIPEASAACSDSPHACETSNDWGGANNHRDPGIWEWCTYMARFGGACKCNDVTATLTCSEDKTQAFRCTGGKVELLDCAQACQPAAAGGDAVCVAKPQSTGDAGADTGASSSSSSGGPIGSPPPQPGVPDKGGASADPPAGGPNGPPAQSSGCRASPAGPADFGGLLLVAGAIFAVRRRRR